MEIASIVSQRSTCQRAQVGAIIVKDNRIISTGYGGAPSGMPHCLDEGCLMGNNEGCIRTIHAEVNTIAFAARSGISVKGATMYVTLSPCYNCSKLIINSGIKRVIYKEEYRDTSGVNLLQEAGIEVERFQG